MQQPAVVAQQFGNTASAYLTSTVHAQGADLVALREIAAALPKRPVVLDLGCGAGHASFAVAPVAESVTAYDLSPQMLEVVADAALARGHANLGTQQGNVTSLPYPDGIFCMVITRFSAHHWQDVPAALREIRRVLKPKGIVVIIDITAPETPLHDTTLQAVELLRDGSHVRDYRPSEWTRMLNEAGFHSERLNDWKLEMKFDEWTERMRTPAERVTAIRSLLRNAPEETRQYFAMQADDSFSIDSTMFQARKA
ncbi:methyltransferase domain-containing protein [Duganella sp. FT80W]|uniref:Methyltransferase domain-containing protein n=1 Tax=Duganella guangzhouensis TaxID=2666084 RepID=A0A6I2L169_9BURK|nr:class I SAM-dependent methyltransferase [Duganella guangzhouensis]MRW91613.1 methyltransferase domain-containing protein [Duganella guangzhouensis]